MMRSIQFYILLLTAASTTENNLIPWTDLYQAEVKMVVLNTWPLTAPTEAAWNVLNEFRGGNAVDAVVEGCTVAEEDRSVTTVGYGGSPDERGNTTLDAMIMDGDSMDASP